ncbi:hypothetical protein EDB80DRAFT_708868 [Ilyonectria destructans]|nr:hypothetical protein EDB80DRAFT_708868 [Ilyonectria destructans]
MQDLTHPFGCDDGTMPDNQELSRMGPLCVKASRKAGRPINLASCYNSFLETAGFLDVVVGQLKVPLNEWPKDVHHNEIGAW